MYRRYLEWHGEIPGKEEVGLKIAQMEEQLPPEEPPPEPEPAVTHVAQSQDSSAVRVAGWVVLGAGVASTVTGIVLLGAALSKQSEINDVSEYDQARHDDLSADGRRYEAGAWIFGGIGLAAIAAGATMLILSRQESPNSGLSNNTLSNNASVTVVPTPGGMAGSFSWKF